jgi:hypothetical protein
MRKAKGFKKFMVEAKGDVMRAFIISLIEGKVQIGDTIFQPSTGKTFPGEALPTSKYGAAEAKEASLEEAQNVIIEYYYSLK